MVQRLAKVAKLESVLVETGQTFAAVAEDRAAEIEAQTDGFEPNAAMLQEAAE